MAEELDMDQMDEGTQGVKKTESRFNIQPIMKKYLKVKNQLVREMLAETFGTLILCVFGLASIAQYKFFDEKKTPFLSVNIAFGLGATIAGIVVGKISGCHINPAVSFAFLITGRMKPLRFVIYLIGQFIGAFMGAFLVWIVYYDAIKNKGLDKYTAEIFTTFPSPVTGIFSILFDQIIATSLLITVVLAVSDKNNNELSDGGIVIIIGLTVTAIGAAFGFNCGFPINPARDLSPRIFTSIAGWKSLAFTANNFYFWIPVVGPMLGSSLGVLLYSLFISNNWS